MDREKAKEIKRLHRKKMLEKEKEEGRPRSKEWGGRPHDKSRRKRFKNEVKKRLKDKDFDSLEDL